VRPRGASRQESGLRSRAVQLTSSVTSSCRCLASSRSIGHCLRSLSLGLSLGFRSSLQKGSPGLLVEMDIKNNIDK
jgi:hypothetical protein